MEKITNKFGDLYYHNEHLFDSDGKHICELLDPSSQVKAFKELSSMEDIAKEPIGWESVWWSQSKEELIDMLLDYIETNNYEKEDIFEIMCDTFIFRMGNTYFCYPFDII